MRERAYALEGAGDIVYTIEPDMLNDDPSNTYKGHQLRRWYVRRDGKPSDYVIYDETAGFRVSPMARGRPTLTYGPYGSLDIAVVKVTALIADTLNVFDDNAFDVSPKKSGGEYKSIVATRIKK